jgi:hypothetical protein
MMERHVWSNANSLHQVRQNTSQTNNRPHNEHQVVVGAWWRTILFTIWLVPVWSKISRHQLDQQQNITSQEFTPDPQTACEHMGTHTATYNYQHKVVSNINWPSMHSNVC